MSQRPDDQEHPGRGFLADGAGPAPDRSWLRRNRTRIALAALGVVAAVVAVQVTVDVTRSPDPVVAAEETPDPDDAVAQPETADQSAAPTPSASGSASPSGRPSATKTPGRPKGDAAPPRAGSWPHPGNTGVPAGWRPKSTRTSDLVIERSGTVVEDLRLVNASIRVRAANVTIRRVEVQGGSIWASGPCRGLVVEDVSFIKSPGQVTTTKDSPVLGPGGLTARRVKVDGVPEGLRVSEKEQCGPMVVEDSFVRVAAPTSCDDWHGDGLQGYYGGQLSVRRSTFVLTEFRAAPCEGTAPFFYPGEQGNTRVDIDGLLAVGGRWFAFVLGTEGSVRNLMLPDGSNPDVKCALLSGWSANAVTIDANFQPTVGAALPCRT
ncbi:hypothetical protein ACFOOK_13555 [Micromonospora krabiensis]|uniref:Uncharacterized protein n=1 Tax=Micromonospora krabiensis TaxID=307121 RepID=A0A1C3N1U2_9ACTN|nr:hypothetical protein [Micromonospora krabiensis]SBV26535.1 hypothetical protein GA0070620_2029 [Micromonospora krabiensis]